MIIIHIFIYIHMCVYAKSSPRIIVFLRGTDSKRWLEDLQRFGRVKLWDLETQQLTWEARKKGHCQDFCRFVGMFSSCLRCLINFLVCCSACFKDFCRFLLHIFCFGSNSIQKNGRSVIRHMMILKIFSLRQVATDSCSFCRVLVESEGCHLFSQQK